MFMCHIKHNVSSFKHTYTYKLRGLKLTPAQQILGLKNDIRMRIKLTSNGLFILRLIIVNASVIILINGCRDVYVDNI